MKKVHQNRVLGNFQWTTEVPPHEKNNQKVAGQRRSKYDVVVRKLRMNRKRQGMWARVATDVHQTITSRLRKRYPDVQWVTRRNKNGKLDLWASYQPENLLINGEDVAVVTEDPA